jgi:hypothetical protein
VPITPDNVASLVATMLSVAAALLVLRALFGAWFTFPALLMWAFALHAWFLNAARPFVHAVAREEWVTVTLEYYGETEAQR